jgi:tetratricopeptide (TPR) repeat protein
MLGDRRDVFVYGNPYVTVLPATTVTVFDYSQPIPVPPPADDPTAAFGDGAAAPPAPAYSEDAQRWFDAARDSFRAGDFEAALQRVDYAIRLQAGDPALHEFRALTLFQLGRFREAAAVAYAVLSAGPGWNWQTMIALYGDPEAYTRQLRELEAYRNANPGLGDVRFLLAYQYLTMGHTEAAVGQLREAARLSPSDSLSPQLIAALTQPAGDSGLVAPPPPPGY